MKVLIGDGGHADDIWEAPPSQTFNRYGWKRVAHHSLVAPDDSYIIGINDPQIRAQVQDELGGLEYSWVHPDAYIGTGCVIGRGTHINYRSGMTRTKVGEHCTIAPGVTICGDVTIGDRVFIGAGVTVRNFVTIGDDAFVCMGTAVTRDVAAGERFKGRT